MRDFITFACYGSYRRGGGAALFQSRQVLINLASVNWTTHPRPSPRRFLCCNKLVIAFSSSVCSSFSSAVTREWLETNGLGGFASSTIIGVNTRRYHGLLVAADKPPVGRAVLLSKLEETLVVDGARHDLSSNQYSGAVHPHGYRLQHQFRLDPFPVFSYAVDGVTVEKSVFMVYGENTTVVSYRVSGAEGRGVKLELRPLVAFRDYHSTTHENAAYDVTIREERGRVRLKPYSDCGVLYLAHNGAKIEKQGHWYRNFEYQEERQRGLDYQEDLFNPLVFEFDLSKTPEAVVVASTEPCVASESHSLRHREIQRRTSICLPGADNDLVAALKCAASQFIVERSTFKTVIAGYHWFGDWGRDTMIALPGLTLSTGQPEIARGILLAFAAHVDRGLIPNRFTEEGAAEYNTIDATLWYFEAVRAYLAATRDAAFVRQNLYGVLRQIVAFHESGTLFNIRVDAAGLLEGGEDGRQLTWMDAKVGDFVVTPRAGKPVEVQALWYNALRTMEALAADFGDPMGQSHYAELATRAGGAFNESFWNDNDDCLYDVVNGDVYDGSIRPNQIFAVSLEYSMLDSRRARAVVDRVERDLLTPYGLRSLSPHDPRYRGRYEHDVRSRDTAYHQGTVWPWLMGPFLRAYRRVYGDNRSTQARVSEWLENFRVHLREAGLGQISEIFDGDSPHFPRGCIAQAWSVAELLRCAVEYAERRADSAL